MTDPVSRPPAFDAQASARAWTERVLRPNGSKYAAFEKFPLWKQWVDKLRDSVEANRIGLSDQKADLDAHTERLDRLNQRVTALEEQPAAPFPVSG